jgi:hypothetical protein
MGATAPTGTSAAHAEHRITTLGSGVRIVTEHVPSVRSVAPRFWRERLGHRVTGEAGSPT